MNPPSDRTVEIELFFQTDQPELLEGLDHLLRLGLVSERQVRQICQERLVCSLPEVIAIPTFEDDFVPLVASGSAPQPLHQARPQPHPVDHPVPQASPHPAPALVPQILNTFMAEISVVWLLFLGVFLVGVSSAVLAATQWRYFSPVGQYSILLSYTLLFWLASYWTQRNPRLQMTSQMLQMATLLVVPINFWMIDGFRLWQNSGGQVIGAIAALLLSGIALHLLRRERTSVKVSYLGLGWLHWGWVFPPFPLVAAYVGSFGAAALLYRWQMPPVSERRSQMPFQPGLTVITGAGLLLLGRAVLGAGVPLSQLSLAIGVMGWLVGWLGQQARFWLWGSVAAVILLLGWLSAVTQVPPWSAIAIGGLAGSLLWQRLQHHWQRRPLQALFGIGLVSFVLLWFCWPAEWRAALATTVGIWSKGNKPLEESFIGLWLFPYLWLALGFAKRLRRFQPLLATHLEQLVLLTGLTLGWLLGGHPLLRSLYFSLGCFTLVRCWQTVITSSFLTYLTHTAGLASLLAWIDWYVANLTIWAWGMILLGLLVAEWTVCLVARSSLWQRSCWYFGLGLAAISYGLLLPQVGLGDSRQGWSLWWLIVPLGLLALSRRRSFPSSRLAAALGVGAVLLAQLLTLWQEHLLMVSSAVGTLLLLGLSRQLPTLAVASLAVGLGLVFSLVTSQQIWGNRFDFWLWGALTLLGLTLLRDGLGLYRRFLGRRYAIACHRWGLGGTTLLLLLMTLRLSLVAFGWPESNLLPQISRAALLIILALGWLYIQRRPHNISFYQFAWAVEVWLVAQSLQLQPSSHALPFLTISNSGLALLTLWIGDFWTISQTRQSRLTAGKTVEARFPFTSWHLIPILYGLAGVLLAHREFVASTGLHTLVAGFTMVGVGRRQSNLKPVTFLGLLTLTLGLFECLIHYLSQLSGGMPGDGLTILALLAGAIALVYGVGHRWLQPYLRIAAPELRQMAHLHWAGATGLAAIATGSGWSDRGLWVWIGGMLILAAYAAWQGRRQSEWVYGGFAQLIWALRFWLEKLLPLSVLGMWAGAIATALSLMIYHLPWPRWGWSAQPWKIAAGVLPGVTACFTGGLANIPSLLLVAAFYAWIAKQAEQIRLSYLSVALADLALLRFVRERALTQPLWGMALVTVSLLYLAQIEPLLKEPDRREQRHWLRCLAIALFSLTALYQSDGQFWPGLGAILLGILMVFVGLALHIRAFLYIGTLTFVIKVLRQLWLYINDNSLVLWAAGIGLGLLLIWVAASFESRRSQAIALLSHWEETLATWE